MPNRACLLLLLFLFPALSSLASSRYADVQILSSDKQGIIFRLEIEEPSLLWERLPGDSSCQLIKRILVGVPYGARPFMAAVRADNGVAFENPTTLPLIEAGGDIAILSGIKEVRGHRMAQVDIYPFRGGLIYTSIEVRVVFEGAMDPGPDEASPFRDKVFEAVYGYSLLNFEDFRTWPTPVRRTAFKPMEPAFGASPIWYRINTSVEGITRVTGSQLAAAGVTLTSLNSDSLHLYYGGGMPLPPQNESAVPAFREIAISIYDGGDGLFEREDYFIFFAEGADRWRYPSDSTPLYLENNYTNLNCYWLAVSGDFGEGGLRVSQVNGAPTGGADTLFTSGNFRARSGLNRLLYVDNTLRVHDYYNWYWTDEARFTAREWLPGLIPAESTFITMRARSGFNANIFVNNSLATRISSLQSIYRFVTLSGISGWNQLYIVLDETSGLPTYLDYLEIAYKGNLAPVNDILDFHLGPRDDVGEIVIVDDFTATPLIWDISAPDSPIQVGQAAFVSGEISFQRQLSPDNSNRFYMCPAAEFLSPQSITRLAVSNLYADWSGTDMFLIAPEQFLESLVDYESYREDFSDISIARISLEQVLYNFSYGQYDPVALRNFLKYAFENSAVSPGVVLLVGDGTFDFENNLQTATINYLPPYIHALDSSASDDNYVYFGQYGLLDSDTSYADDRGYDMLIARWPVKNVSEIATIVDKIKAYESSVSYGPWRTTVTLVADDEFGAFNTEWFHADQTETLQTPPRLPASFRRNKIYLWDYPFDANREKPTVNEAIVRTFNEGTLLVNYVGHGNPDTWAHEHVFNRNTDLPQLHNGDKLPLVLTASCSIGFFDDPAREGMAEDLLRLSGGGGVAVISATRLVYSTDNSLFNQQIFDILFGGDELSIGQTFFTAKLLRQYAGGNPQTVRNDRNYTFFGDPFVKLQVPRYEIRFTQVPDSLSALARHDVVGEVVDRESGIRVPFSGTTDVFVLDSDRDKKYKVVDDDGDSVKTVAYALDGPVIFRGQAAVVNGRFDFSFIAPLDIGYGGQNAKISGYAVSSTADALGLADSLPVSLNISPAADSAGPEIVYTFGEQVNFASGDKIKAADRLNLIISDTSGINLTGSLGHGLTLVVDNNVENTYDLTGLFGYNSGSYTTGAVAWEGPALTAGLHHFKVKVWDNANNSSTAEFTAEVLASEQLLVFDLLNYPNPMTNRTVFSFALTAPASRARLELFTLSGKLIQRIERSGLPAGYVEFCSWDGRDADRDRVATGVYIYKLTAVSEGADETVEEYGKVVVIN